MGVHLAAVAQGQLTLERVDIEVDDEGNKRYGVLANDSSPRLRDVAIRVHGGLFAYGVENDNGSATVLDTVDIDVSGSTYAFGVKNAASSLALLHVDMSLSAATENYGVQSDFSGVIMTDIRITLTSGSSSNWAIANTAYAVTVDRATIRIHSTGPGSSNIGVLSADTATALTNLDIMLTGDAYSNYALSGTGGRVSSSQLYAGPAFMYSSITSGPGYLCSNSVNATTFATLSASCA